MKKLSAILLIGLFIFNLFGYRVLFYFAQKQSDINLEKALDNNQYNEEDLVTIKIPILVPYQVDRKEFERYSGEVTVDGKIYKYVKRKVSDGNLILLCLPDHNKMHLETAKNNLFKNSNDLQNSDSRKSDNSKSFSGKTFSNEYDQNIAEYQIGYCTILPDHRFVNLSSPLSVRFHNSPEQPPDLVQGFL